MSWLILDVNLTASGTPGNLVKHILGISTGHFWKRLAEESEWNREEGRTCPQCGWAPHNRWGPGSGAKSENELVSLWAAVDFILLHLTLQLQAQQTLASSTYTSSTQSSQTFSPSSPSASLVLEACASGLGYAHSIQISQHHDIYIWANSPEVLIFLYPHAIGFV